MFTYLTLLLWFVVARVLDLMPDLVLDTCSCALSRTSCAVALLCLCSTFDMASAERMLFSRCRRATSDSRISCAVQGASPRQHEAKGRCHGRHASLSQDQRRHSNTPTKAEEWSRQHLQGTKLKDFFRLQVLKYQAPLVNDMKEKHPCNIGVIS